MLTGVVPFSGDTLVEIAMKHLSSPPEPPSAKRAEIPRDLDMILLAPREVSALLVLAVPTAVGLSAALVALLPGPTPWPALLTELLTGYVLVGIYEWTHFLIHTAHRPRSRLYRSVWQTHRLHHFKNEHYWHGITNTIADSLNEARAPSQSLRATYCSPA